MIRRVNISPEMGSRHVLERDARNSVINEPAEVVIPADLEVMDEPVVFIGAFWPHYGHFNTDAMSKLWGMDRVDGLPLLMQARPRVRSHGQSYIHEIHAQLGLVERGLIVWTKPTLVRRVLAARAALQHTFRLYDCHQTHHLKVGASVLAE